MSEIEESALFTPQFNDDGLMPCIAVDDSSGDVLMLAWVNSEAIAATMETGYAHYWSRSRGQLWKKGATSGALQQLREIRVDCDQDTLIYRVEPRMQEDTCHTGRTTCFYRSVSMAPGSEAAAPDDPGNRARNLLFIETDK